MIGGDRGSVPHMGEIVDWQIFSGVLFGNPTYSRPRALESHILGLYVNRRGFGQGCAFGGLINISHPVGKLLPQTPRLQDVNGDYQLKRLCVYLDTEETDQNA